MPPQRPSLPAGDVAELGELLTFLLGNDDGQRLFSTAGD